MGMKKIRENCIRQITFFQFLLIFKISTVIFYLIISKKSVHSNTSVLLIDILSILFLIGITFSYAKYIKQSKN